MVDAVGLFDFRFFWSLWWNGGCFCGGHLFLQRIALSNHLK